LPSGRAGRRRGHLPPATCEEVPLDEYVRVLAERGARLIPPERMDRPPGWRCDVVLRDGLRLTGTGRTEAEAIASAVLKLEEVEEAPSA
jgi:hypothetical protein